VSCSKANNKGIPNPNFSFSQFPLATNRHKQTPMAFSFAEKKTPAKRKVKQAWIFTTRKNTNGTE